MSLPFRSIIAKVVGSSSTAQLYTCVHACMLFWVGFINDVDQQVDLLRVVLTGKVQNPAWSRYD